MTIPELQKRAAFALEFGIKRLREHGALAQQFELVTGEGSEMIQVDGQITNSEAAKSAVSRLVRERLKRGDVEAVIMLGDTFWAKLSPEAHKLRLALGLTVEQAGKAGLCTTHEAVLVTLESPIYSEMRTQRYRRDNERIELDGDVEVLTGGRTAGRFMGLFPDQPQPGAPQ